MSYHVLGGFVVESNPAGNCLALVVVMAGLLGLCGAFRSLQAEVPIGCASCCSRGFREIKEGRDHFPNASFVVPCLCFERRQERTRRRWGGAKDYFAVFFGCFS